MQSQPQPVGRAAIWFFRFAGPALLLVEVYHALNVNPEDWGFIIMLAPLYLGTWIGLGVVFVKYRANRSFALPCILMAVGVALGLSAPWFPYAAPGFVPGKLYFRLMDAAGLFQLASQITMTWVGWRTQLPPRM